MADLRLAATQMSGAKRRAFQAEMAEQYCAGNARQAERRFGRSRETAYTSSRARCRLYLIATLTETCA